MLEAGVPGLSLWTFVGVMQLMFGVTWLAAARLSDPLRQALLSMAWFNLLTGASLLLMGQRETGSYFLTHTVANLMQVVGYVLLWRAGAGLTGAPASHAEQRLLVLLAGSAVLLLGMSPVTEQERYAVSLLANAWVLVRAGTQAARQLRQSGAVGVALAIQIFGAMAVTALVVRALGGLLFGAEVDLRFRGMLALAWSLVLPIFAVNVIAAYQAFGRVVQDVNRLARLDALTGLADDATLQAALAHAWRRFCQWQRPVALLEVSVDQLATLRANFGSGTADAVLAELALKLKHALRPGDVLAHCGDGLFRIVLPDTVPAQAQALARSLVGAVGADGGLHPESDQRLTLSAGLAQAQADDRSPAALGQRARAQRLCAWHAGGDQLVANAVGRATVQAARLHGGQVRPTA